MNAYETFKKHLVLPLEQINTTSGYDNDVTALEGWITQYANDLETGKGGKSFPAVVVRPAVENCNTKQINIGANNHTDNNADRVYAVMGAVSLIESPETYVERLESLLLDVKRSLSDTRHVTLRKVEFQLPENGIGYATFELTVTLNLTEKLEKPKP